MGASDRTGIRKERGQALAVSLIEALALGHHVRFGMAELRRRTSGNGDKWFPLEFFFEFSQGAWCHAALLDFLTGWMAGRRRLACLFRGRIGWMAGCEHEGEHHPAPCNYMCRLGVHGDSLSLPVTSLLSPRTSVGRPPLRAA